VTGVRLAAALALSALAGCDAGPGAADRAGRAGAPAATVTPTPTPTPREEVLAVLERRSAALQRGRPRALAATATGRAQRARDRRAARNARGLPLREVRYEVLRDRIGRRRATLRVRSTYRLRGVPGRQGATRSLRLRRRDGAWRVMREGVSGERHPWELAPYTAGRTRRLLVLAPPGIDAAEVGARLEDARRLAERTLEVARLRRRLLVVIAGSDAQASALTSDIPGVAELTAITDAEVRVAGPALRVQRVVSVRLLVPWKRFAALDAAGQARVVAHELTHAALVRRTSGRTPAWLQEGLALYASRDERRDVAAAYLRDRGLTGLLARPGLRLRALARPDAIARLSGPALPAAYAYSSAAAAFVAARHGEPALRRLYLAFNDPSLAGRPGPRVVDRALRRVLGTSAAAFERELRAWIG
jgi:hypothetical protein